MWFFLIHKSYVIRCVMYHVIYFTYRKTAAEKLLNCIMFLVGGLAIGRYK